MSEKRRLSDLPPSYEESAPEYTQINPINPMNPVTLPPIQPPIETPFPIRSSPNETAYPTRSSPDLVAAEALARMTGTPPPISRISTPMSNLSIDEQRQLQHPLIAKVNQVSRIPLVRDAFKYYEDSKRNYPHFNYAAGIVERAAIPVVSRIEVNLNNRHRQRLENPIRKKRRRNNKRDRKETKKRLQFCLHLLRLANDQITNQVSNLQTKLSEREKKQQPVYDEKRQKDDDDDLFVDSVSIQQSPSPAPDVPNEAEKTNTEIITTVKKIIHVISNFKTTNLSASDNNESDGSELRSTIRDIILKLPRQIQQTNSGTNETNDKIFVFAKESLDMISRLTNVFDEQLQKAESWIGTDDVESINSQANSQTNSQQNSQVPSRSQSPVIFQSEQR